MKKEWMLIDKYQKELTILGQIGSLLSWDEETYMPEKGIMSRSEQNSLLSGIAHETFTSGEFFSAVKKLKKLNLKGREKLMIDKLYKDISKSKKIPSEFVKEFSREVTLSGQAWRNARKKNDFNVFAPHLEKLVKLLQKRAKILKVKGHPYNSLLDDYEEGMTVEKLIPIFAQLKKDLISLLSNIESSARYKKQKLVLMKKKFDKDILKSMVFDICKRMGLEDDKSRIDVSEHPFTTKIGVGDVRITTGYRKSPMFAFLSTVHEAGHALYELGMPEKDEYNILGGAPSVGLHESQSRFWENQIARGKDFWKFYFPKFKREFGIEGNLEDWYKEVNFVSPSYIRVESDEVHYCLHIILRLEIEMGLIDGSIKISNLQKVWNQKFKEMFGVTPRSDVEGVLQDVHWSMGSFGYFPTYAIGTMYSAQFYDKIREEIKGMEKQIEKGNFESVRNWLKKNVHEKGSRYLADDIVKQVCGEGLNPKIYVDYLNEKYGKIYRF